MKTLAKYQRELADLLKIEEKRNLTAEEDEQFRQLENAIQRREEYIEEQRNLSPAGEMGAGNLASSTSNGGFKDGPGEFIQALFRKSRGEGFDERLHNLQVAGMSNGDSGGFAVPTQFVHRAFDNGPVGDSGIVLLNLCDRVKMTSNKMTAPGFVNNTHENSPYGIAWGQVAEGEEISESNVELRGIQLEAKKSAALFYCTNEWLADSSSFMRQRLNQIFYDSLRWYIESQILTGSGAGTALGALNAPATLEIAKESGQLADSIVTENILNMWARLLPGSHSRAVWMANATCFPKLASLTMPIKNVAGTENVGGSVVSLLQVNNNGIAGQPATSILGRPLYFSEHLPALGNAGDIILVDPLSYVLGDRQQVTLDASPHYKFNQAKTTFRAQARFDGQPAMSGTFTPANGDSCGWCVKVEERA